MDRALFLQRYGAIYEDSPWVAEATWDRLGGAPDESRLAAELAATVDAADEQTRLALICAHPDLAGRAAVRGELGTQSTAEQRSAGIDRCSPEEYREFQELNAEYRDRFGFPFVIAVRDRSRQAILEAFRRRTGNDRASEFATAIAEIHRIAALRIAALRETEDP